MTSEIPTISTRDIPLDIQARKVYHSFSPKNLNPCCCGHYYYYSNHKDCQHIHSTVRVQCGNTLSKVGAAVFCKPGHAAKNIVIRDVEISHICKKCWKKQPPLEEPPNAISRHELMKSFPQPEAWDIPTKPSIGVHYLQK